MSLRYSQEKFPLEDSEKGKREEKGKPELCFFCPSCHCRVSELKPTGPGTQWGRKPPQAIFQITAWWISHWCGRVPTATAASESQSWPRFFQGRKVEVVSPISESYKKLRKLRTSALVCAADVCVCTFLLWGLSWCILIPQFLVVLRVRASS